MQQELYSATLELPEGALDGLAYIRHEKIGPDWVWSIYAAENGAHIGYTKELKIAFELVRQKELAPFCVH